MTLLIWSDALSVGVTKLDDQHKQIIECLNALHAASQAGKPESVLGQMLTTLTCYAHDHMAEEEAYFSLFDYPGAERHKQEHLQFRDKVATLRQRLPDADRQLALDLMKFLCDWFVNHIQGTDLEYVDLARHGRVK